MFIYSLFDALQLVNKKISLIIVNYVPRGRGVVLEGDTVLKQAPFGGRFFTGKKDEGDQIL